jgi:5-methylcytosine-specific restriction protein A
MAKFTPPFPVGSVVTNSDITTAFSVGNMGGMRRSKKTGTLVIISDHTKGLYDDKWYGEILHYTGMGKIGDQIITGNQNKTLAESDTNGVEVHLFEVLQPSEYIYRGIVRLVGKPYQEEQKDDDGNLRKVWMFPLSVVGSAVSVSAKDLDSYEKTQERKAKSLTAAELEVKAKERSSKKAAHRTVTSDTYVRDSYVAEYAKVRAKGICQLCGKTAPFTDKDGKPYLESHHVIWLSEGGEDSVTNTVALCPNCHRKMHVVNDPMDKALLLKKAKS